MAKIPAGPTTQEWRSIMELMQEPWATRGANEPWAEMQEVFHLD